MQIQRTNNQPNFGSIGRGLNSHISIRRQAGIWSDNLNAIYTKLYDDTSLMFGYDRVDKILLVEELESGEQVEKEVQPALEGLLSIAGRFLELYHNMPTVPGKSKLQEVMAKLNLEGS